MEVRSLFKENISTYQCPARRGCLKAIEASKKAGGLLSRRNWVTVKKKVWNLIQTEKKNGQYNMEQGKQTDKYLE